jgi:hypothetical protein
MSAVQGRKSDGLGPESFGDCRCKKCRALGRQEILSGRSVSWLAINLMVHKGAPRIPASSKYSPLTPSGSNSRASATQDPGGRRTVTTAELAAKCQCKSCVELTRQIQHGFPRIPRENVDLTKPGIAATDAAKKRFKHIYGMEMPFSFTLDQAVGFAGGLTLSLPVISVFGLTPDVGVYVVAGLTALGTSTPWFIGKARDTEKRKTATPAAPKPSRKTRLASARQDHEAVLLAWARYETDVALQIDYPAMTDVRKPETAALAKALRAAEIASRHAQESLRSLIHYEGAVLDLEGAFKAAGTAAKLDQENPLTADQKTLAHTLLAMAVDPAGNVHERRQAHQRLLKLLDGVILLAEPARLALEAAAARGEIAK